jgi:hypothetical protein
MKKEKIIRKNDIEKRRYVKITYLYFSVKDLVQSYLYLKSDEEKTINITYTIVESIMKNKIFNDYISLNSYTSQNFNITPLIEFSKFYLFENFIDDIYMSSTRENNKDTIDVPLNIDDFRKDKKSNLYYLTLEQECPKIIKFIEI